MAMVDEAEWVTEMELSETVDDLHVPADVTISYRRARVLVRLHRRPIGFLTVPVHNGVIDGTEIRMLALRSLRDEIGAHMAIDGSPGTVDITAMVLPAVDCLREQAGLVGEDYPLVSVVVCTRNRADLLPACIDGLRCLRYPKFEVIIVDNAPSDDETERVFAEQTSGDGRFRYVREPKPGLSRARNCGLAVATGDVIAFTDDDVVVDQWWLNGIVAGFGTHPDTGCVTGLIPALKLDTEAQRYFDRRVSWSSSCSSKVFNLGENAGTSPLFPYAAGQYGAGANFALSRKLIEEGLGGFDEALGAGSPAGGGEDLDMFLRVILSGSTLVYEPAAVVWHLHRTETDELSKQLHGYGKGLTAYMMKTMMEPGVAKHLLKKAPQGLLHTTRLLARPAGNATEDRPARSKLAFAVAEVRGLAAGPRAYYQGCRQN